MADGARDDDEAWVTKDGVLEHVEVFRRGAEIRRRVALAEGERAVRIAPLPLELDDGSVRVEVVRGAASLRAFRVSLDVRSDGEAPMHVEPEELRALRARLRGVTLELDEVRVAHARVAGLSIPARPERDHGRPPPPAPDRSRLALLELRFALEREHRERAHALEQEKRELERTLRTLVERQSQRSSDRPLANRVHKAVELELEHAVDGAVLEIHYRVRSARWAPSYRVSYDTRDRRARLAMRAVIAQRTGEDWRGATLSVSTARMDGWYDLPELASVRIGRAQPAPRTGYRPLPEGGAALFDDRDRALGAPIAKVILAETRTQAGVLRADITSTGVYQPSNAPFGPPPVQGVPGGAPPPPPSAAPMPRQAAAAPAAPMPSSMAAPVGGAMPQTFSAQAKRAKGGGLMSDLLGGFGGGTPAEAAREQVLAEESDDHGGAAAMPAASVAPSASLLDYGALRLAPPTELDRGALRPIDLATRAREAGRADAVIQQALAAARGAESSFASLSPPAFHSYPDALLGFDYRYDAGGRIEVPSDGAFHTVAITEAEGPASMLHVTVPREDPAVFRLLELASPLEGAVLRGPADLYLDGALLVSGSLSPTPTGGKLEVGMGVDESIKVARNVRFREESAGLMGGTASLVHELDVEVQNASASAIRLEVRERLPVLAKGEEDIEIRPGKTSPPWLELAQDDPPLEGGKRWVVEIAAGDKASLSTEYAIRIAAKNELVGGNRRG